MILAAVLLDRIDDMGVYQGGSFIPILEAEYFQLLLKKPSRFAVKYFEVVRLRSQVFKKLETILRNAKTKQSGKLRKTTLSTVVTFLYQFISR